jgi:hypothetical protein
MGITLKRNEKRRKEDAARFLQSKNERRPLFPPWTGPWGGKRGRGSFQEYFNPEEEKRGRKGGGKGDADHF